MLEFILFCFLGAVIGLRFRPVMAAMLGIVVLATCIILALVASPDTVDRVVSVLLSLVGFNLGLLVGLALDRRRGQVAGSMSNVPSGIGAAPVRPASRHRPATGPGPSSTPLRRS